MRNKISFHSSLTILSCVILVAGCMQKYPSGSGNGLGGGGLFNSGTNSVLNGGTLGAGGSGSAGALTNADTSALKNVVSASDALSVSNDANARSLGIDSAISEELTAEINRILAAERQGQDVLSAKWALLPQILEQCAAKTRALVPIPGQPLIGDWTGSGACGLGTFSINGPGNAQVYSGTIGGVADVRVTAYNDGRFELRSSKWNGNGKDSGYQGQNLSGVGTLTTQTSQTSKYGTTYSNCQAQVKLVTSRNPIPENYKTAIKAMGSCYRKSAALLGMGPIFKDMNPALAQTLLQQMMK